ncbi:hypothetical protein N7475_006082 [Penicillium sp. IBT 31633x]|nr:hypothetical protein N7475_006082 [Penicillium sp. IBT 31633x]
MPDQPRRIIMEKSKTVKRRYQRSNQRFKFTASQIERLDREQEREKKAKQLREKEKKRIANKKRKAEQEERAREERKRRGIPDPNAPRVPSSQPLLSMFLGAKKEQSPVTPEPGPIITDAESYEGNGENADFGSAGGDTEAESEAESEAFDDLDEELENDLSELQDASVLAETEKHDVGIENMPSSKDDDEFSDCSAFDDEDIMKEAEAAGTKPKNPSITKEKSFLQPCPSDRPSVPSLESSFGDSSQYDATDFLEAEAAVIMQTNNDGTKDHHPSQQTPLLRPPVSDPMRSIPTLASSFGDSFRDETADWIEETFAHGDGDPFGELNKIPS